jgi:hypothetical protein
VVRLPVVVLGDDLDVLGLKRHDVDPPVEPQRITSLHPVLLEAGKVGENPQGRSHHIWTAVEAIQVRVVCEGAHASWAIAPCCPRCLQESAQVRLHRHGTTGESEYQCWRYQVQETDTCDSIIGAANISVSPITFVAWNPNIKPVGTNLPSLVGQHICLRSAMMNCSACLNLPSRH